MLKKELIWREIIQKSITSKQFEFTQKELAQKLHVSLSTVFNALKIPRQTGAIKVTGKNFSLIDVEKLLYIWATQRNIEKETAYKTYVAMNSREIEGLMPAKIIFAAYSAYSQKYNNAPAEYDKVYVYADKQTLFEIQKRFPIQKGDPNLFVLKSDPLLKNFGAVVPESQIFCDLWNLRDWYAKEFLKSLKEKIIPS